MSEIAEPITQAPEPIADLSPEVVAAAFAEQKPYNPNPEPAPVAAPEAPAVVPAADAPPVAPTPAVVPTEPATSAPDYAAWLKSQELPEDVTVIKTALQTAAEAETLRANQRTAQDVALAKLFEDPNAGAQYVKLQTTDFNALPDRELHAAAYAHKHPGLPAEVAAIRARREYDAEFAAAEHEDPDDQDVQEAKVLRAAARAEELQTMEQAKTAARDAVLAKATPTAEGPSEAETQARIAEEARATKWATGVEDIVSAPSLEIAYTVDGQELKLAFDHKAPAFKEAMLDPAKWLFGQVCPDGNPENMNLDRLAEIVALSTQTDTILKNTLSAGKASLGPVIPLTTAVNPLPNAPQAPGNQMTIEEAFAQAKSVSRNSNY